MTEPDQLSSNSSPAGQSAALVAELRGVIRKQGEEIEELRRQLQEQVDRARKAEEQKKDESKGDDAGADEVLISPLLSFYVC